VNTIGQPNRVTGLYQCLSDAGDVRLYDIFTLRYPLRYYMPKDPNEFRAKTRTELAKRAAHRCSAPSCQKVTSGPHSEAEKSVDIGEAAHIRGGKPGSARYVSEMTSEERRSISNGIWLCRFCAKMIDNDENRFSVDILYEWKRTHEERILHELGSEPGQNEERQRIKKLFENESPPALQLALDKPPYWEYLLTIELFRERVNRLKETLDDVRNGLVLSNAKLLNEDHFVVWFQEKLYELQKIMGLTMRVVNHEITASWGKEGEPGDPRQIKKVADLAAVACSAFIEWELGLQYAIFPEYLDEEKQEMKGWAQLFLTQIEKIPEELGKPFKYGIENYNDDHQIILVFELPSSAETLGDRIVQKLETHI
jgi:hypothetical protein